MQAVETGIDRWLAATTAERKIEVTHWQTTFVEAVSEPDPKGKRKTVAYAHGATIGEALAKLAAKLDEVMK